MTKQDDIFSLYNQLNKSGSRGQAIRFIATLFGIKGASVKAHWMLNKEIPDYVTDEQLDEIIAYLKNAITIQKQPVES